MLSDSIITSTSFSNYDGYAREKAREGPYGIKSKDPYVSPNSSKHNLSFGGPAENVAAQNYVWDPYAMTIFDYSNRGVFLTSYTAGRTVAIERIIKRIKASGANTVIIDIKNVLGTVGSPMGVPLAQKIKAESTLIAYLPQLVEKLHQRGIKVVGRICLFKDRKLAHARPDLAIKDKKTGKVWQGKNGGSWVDPYSQEVVDYNIALAEAAAKMGIDEIQFDYIRFPTPDEGDIKNCLYTHNKKGKEKCEVIESFLKQARRALNYHNVTIGIDVYGVAAWELDDITQVLGQRVREMAKHVDVICPMFYPSHFPAGWGGLANPADHPYKVIYRGCRRMMRAVKGIDVRIVPWIQGSGYKVKEFHLHDSKKTVVGFDERYLKEQIKAVYDVGLSSYFVWNSKNWYTEFWRALPVFKDRF